MYNRGIVLRLRNRDTARATIRSRPYREADYLGLPGRAALRAALRQAAVTLAPTARHQQVVVRIVHVLVDCADRHGDQVLVSPIDVVLADHSVVQPDVIYVRAARSSIVRERVEGAPDLAIEVLSPGTARRDLGEAPALR